MIAAILAKIGLAAVDGKTLWPVAGIMAGFALLVALGLYAVHHYTAQGYDKATAECRENARIAGEWKTYLEGELRAANEPVITDQVRDQTTLAAGKPARRQEVEANVQSNRVDATCRLNPDGLRLWNAPPSGFDSPLLIPPGADEPKSGQPPALRGAGAAGPATQPDRFEGSLPLALAQASRPFAGGGQLPHRAGREPEAIAIGRTAIPIGSAH